MAEGGTNVFAQSSYGRLLHFMRDYFTRSCQGREILTNALSSNLKTGTLKVFHVMNGIKLENKPLISLQNYGTIYP